MIETKEVTLDLTEEEAQQICKMYPKLKGQLLNTFSAPSLDRTRFPRTYEEFAKLNRSVENEWFIDDNCVASTNYSSGDRSFRKDTHKNSSINEETAMKSLKFTTLVRIRDCYRAGWRPDWNGQLVAYSIECSKSGLLNIVASPAPNPFSFQSSEIASEFLRNYSKDILDVLKI